MAGIVLRIGSIRSSAVQPIWYDEWFGICLLDAALAAELSLFPIINSMENPSGAARRGRKKCRVSRCVPFGNRFCLHTTEDDNDREVIPGAGAFAPGPWKRGVVACAMGRVFLFVCASTFLCQSVGRCTACVCACACVGGWVVKGWFANRNEKSFDVPVLLCLCACAYP